jgi:hypothetical protein
MVKTANSNSSSPVSTGEAQKQRKKQAKREAKAMLAVERAKVVVEKAKQKLAKAQTRLEARSARLRTREANLAEIRSSHEVTEVSAPDSGFDQKQGQPEQTEETTSSNQSGASASDQEKQPGVLTPTDQETSMPSSEEQTDLSPTASLPEEEKQG